MSTISPIAPPSVPSRLLTVSEAAAWTGLSKGTLDNWRSAGKGPKYHRLGAKAVRYRVEDLEAFLSEGA